MTTAIVTVNPAPMPISGTSYECVGTTIILSDATGGGTWSGAGDVSVATTGTNSATVMAGSSVGTGAITYTLPTGCFVTYATTIKANPSAILGIANVCTGGTTQFSGYDNWRNLVDHTAATHQ